MTREGIKRVTFEEYQKLDDTEKMRLRLNQLLAAVASMEIASLDDPECEVVSGAAKPVAGAKQARQPDNYEARSNLDDATSTPEKKAKKRA